MKYSRLLALAVVTIGCAAPAMPAAAQSGSPARQNQEVFDVSNKESDYFEHTFRNAFAAGSASYANALRFASCAVPLNSAGAAALLGTDAGSAAEARGLREFTKRHGVCAVSRESISPMIVRGAIAETLWKQAGANPNPAKRSTVQIEDVEGFIKAAPLGEQRAKSANLPLSWVSRCQVMALPEEAAKVLATAPGSEEEKSAAQALYAASNVCGVVKGLEKTSATLVRAGLADAFYQDARRVTMASSR